MWEFFGLLLAIIGTFSWMRYETKSEILELKYSIDALTKMVYGEMRDFHGRLMSLEERMKAKEK